MWIVLFQFLETVCYFLGDGIKGAAEGCDDGNTAGGDGCSSSCTVESGWTCSHSASGSTCTVSAVTCPTVTNSNVANTQAFSCTGKTPSTTCVYSCNNCYKSSGATSVTLTCQSTGLWSPSTYPACTLTTCSSAPSVTNGSLKTACGTSCGVCDDDDAKTYWFLDIMRVPV